MKYLDRIGSTDKAEYSNTEVSENFLVKGKDSYLGSLVDLMDGIEYASWVKLDHSLKTGEPLHDQYGGVKDTTEIYKNFIYKQEDFATGFNDAIKGMYS